MATKKRENRPSFIKEKHLGFLDIYVELDNPMNLDSVKDDADFADLTIDQLRHALSYYKPINHNRPRVKATHRHNRILNSMFGI